MSQQWDSLWLGANLATMKDGAYSSIQDAALAVKDGRIAWLGKVSELESAPEQLATKVHDISQKWVTPGFIDCHTHLVFGGNRADEFEKRLQGVSYEEIARAGGGILSTVTATRAASEAELLAAAENRLAPLLAEGVTTIEIKSGYGLDTETELKMLRVARQLGERHAVRVKTTFLGAHALPPEYKEDRGAYLKLVREEMLPAVAAEGLADAVDAFMENIAFTAEEVAGVFDKARELGLPVKLHADQLSDGGGAALASQYGALSADHVEYTGEAGIAAMGKAGTVAVLLPGAWYTLRETRLPDIEAYRKHKVPMAIATDANPGSSPVLSICTMISMACTSFRLTPEEALAGATCIAARALGDDELGSLEVGKHADFLVWDIQTPAEIAYWLGGCRPSQRIFAGEPA